MSFGKRLEASGSVSPGLRMARESSENLLDYGIIGKHRGDQAARLQATARRVIAMRRAAETERQLLYNHGSEAHARTPEGLRSSRVPQPSTEARRQARQQLAEQAHRDRTTPQALRKMSSASIVSVDMTPSTTEMMLSDGQRSPPSTPPLKRNSRAVAADGQRSPAPSTPPARRNSRAKAQAAMASPVSVVQLGRADGAPDVTTAPTPPKRIPIDADIDTSVAAKEASATDESSSGASKRAPRAISRAKMALYTFEFVVVMVLLWETASLLSLTPSSRRDLFIDQSPEALLAAEGGRPLSPLAKTIGFCITALRASATLALIAGFFLPALLGPAAAGAAGAGAAGAGAAGAVAAAATGGKRLQLVGAAASALMAVATRLSPAARVVAPAVAATRAARAGAGMTLMGVGLHAQRGAVGALLGVLTAVLI